MATGSKHSTGRGSVDLDIVCRSCNGTGLYIGVGERDGTAVVCYRCKGTGRDAYHFEYEPFVERASPPQGVKSVHVARGYGLGHDHPKCDGGLPIAEWEPGKIVPADEQLYCPYLYTHQGWCAKPEPSRYDGRLEAPLLAGDRISECKHWPDKADCWRIFHSEAPEDARRQVS